MTNFHFIGNPSPSTAEQFKNAFLKGAGKGAERAHELQKIGAEAMKKHQIAQQEQAQKLRSWNEFENSPAAKLYSPQQLNILKNEWLGNVSAQTTKSLINADRDIQNRNEFGNAFATQGQNIPPNEDNSPIQQQNQGLPTQAANANQSVPDAQLLELMKSPNKQVRDTAANLYKANQGERHFAHKETSKYGEEIREGHKAATEGLEAVKDIEKILKKSPQNVGVNPRNVLHSYFKKKESPFADIFLNEDTQSMVTATKSLVGGAYRRLFGAKPTASEFFWFESILPNILKDVSTNKASLNYFKKLYTVAEKEGQIYDEIVKENKGFRPIDIESQVRDRMRGDLDKLISEGYELVEGAPPDRLTELFGR